MSYSPVPPESRVKKFWLKKKGYYFVCPTDGLHASWRQLSMEADTCIGCGVKDHNEVCVSAVGIHLRGLQDTRVRCVMQASQG